MECRGKILIVDDNQDILLSLNMLLKPWVEAIRVISNPERIIEFMDSFQPDVILLDMNFRKDMVSGEEGYEWLARILEHDPTSVVVFMTAYISTEKTVRAIRAGALDFVAKPWDNKRMLEVVHSAVDMKRSKMAQIQAQEQEDQNGEEAQSEGSNFIGESPQILELKSRMGRVARTDANVLITGENGTGKDVLARELHRLSKRGDQPFVSIDLGCVHEQLFESELFGHVKGSFTGAVKDDILDIESLAMVYCNRMKKLYPDLLSARYKLGDKETFADMTDYELLCYIGKKRGFLISGGDINTERTADMLLDEFRAAKLGRITLDRI